ncbi:hypothetical protein [Saccharibacillus kuerlensis]|uniref:Uncharacterized protein n=1 Tax=Saccharibacillus kuerlensis TaxID=459527 RepID=A0ABQ2KU17_9BACL|nr:hypothetical protein [Saccharibacillus kuerlensis]GGN92729.1 hypothetical protein GCM10010969_05560 [Saccharibacillus kuerlensis]
MKKFITSKAFWIPFILVLILGIWQNFTYSNQNILSALTSALIAALIAGVVIGGVVYLMFEISGIRRGRK